MNVKYFFSVMPTKSDSDVIFSLFCLQYLSKTFTCTLHLTNRESNYYSTFIRLDGLICRLIILFAYLSKLMKISENKGKLNKIKYILNSVQTVLVACYNITSDTI